jgi:hypothetical protein
MLGIAVVVDAVLPAGEKQPLLPLDQLGLVESEVGGLRRGVDRRSSHVRHPPSVSRSGVGR